MKLTSFGVVATLVLVLSGFAFGCGTSEPGAGNVVKAPAPAADSPDEKNAPASTSPARPSNDPSPIPIEGGEPMREEPPVDE